jgi:alpha-1,2-mannosyltransferase
MSRSRLLCLAALAYLLVGAILVIHEALREVDDPGDSDVPAFATAATLVMHDRAHLYDPAAQESVEDRLVAIPPGTQFLQAFNSPPLAAVLVAPLDGLNIRQAAALLVVACIAIQAVAVVLLLPLGPRAGPARPLIMATALLPFPALFDVAQMDPLVLLGLAAALRLRSRPVLSGLCLSLMLLKPQLVWLVVPALAVTGRWRELLGFAAGALAQAVLSLALVGVDGLRGLASIVAGAHLTDTGSSIGLPALLAPLVGGGVAAYLIGSLVAIGMVALLVALRHRLRSRVDLIVVLGVVCSILAAPHVIYQDVVVLAPALLLIALGRPTLAIGLSLALIPPFVLVATTNARIELIPVVVLAIGGALLTLARADTPAPPAPVIAAPA